MWAPGSAGADQLHPGQVARLIAHLVGRGDDHHPQELQGGATALDGRLAGDDLEHRDAGEREVADNAGAVGAGLLHADALQLAGAGHPADERPVAGTGGREGVRTDDGAALVDERGHVQVLVGVDATEHLALKAWHAAHC